MRALFIIHSQNTIYGAGRSIANLIRNIDVNMEIDLIFPLQIKKDNRITLEKIKKYFGENVKNVWFLPQPFRLSVLQDTFGLIAHLKNIIKEILYLCVRPYYKYIFCKGNYDFIHLNSVTLFPMLDNRWPMFLHVRESIRKPIHFWNHNLAKKMNEARGVLFINPASESLAPPCMNPHIMLINPFDQTKVGKVNLQSARIRFSLSGDETVYAVIGTILYDKGVDFVIRAFQKAKLKNAVLLIVGKNTGNDSYIQRVLRLAKNDSHIRFTGEIEDIEQVYRVIDYVVRGDTTAGLGRTVYEALYSGCGIINPMDSVTYDVPQITFDMKSRVHFYTLRDENALIKVFQETQYIRFENRAYYSNVQKYVQKFLKFVQENSGKRVVEQ